MSKKFHFRGSFDKQHGKRAQTLLKSRLFPNTLSADGKYSLLNRDNLTQPIQMQLSQKRKTFSEFFSAVFKYRLNFQRFQKEK